MPSWKRLRGINSPVARFRLFEVAAQDFLLGGQELIFPNGIATKGGRGDGTAGGNARRGFIEPMLNVLGAEMIAGQGAAEVLAFEHFQFVGFEFAGVFFKGEVAGAGPPVYVTLAHAIWLTDAEISTIGRWVTALSGYFCLSVSWDSSGS